MSTALGVAGLALCANSAVAAKSKRIPVGVQLYSLREECKKDLPGTLKAVAKIGYKGVEFAGYWDRSASDLRKMLDDNGLVACGTHTSYESILPDKLQETIEFNKVIGNKYIIVPGMDGKTKEGWLEKARFFNEVAAKLKPEKMYTGYHAHAGDFKKFGDVTAWDLFFGNTNKNVIMQLDTSNCIDGGADPYEILKRYPGRARTVHLKPNGGGPEGVIGQDKIDWKDILEFCETKGKTEWYIVEHESSKNPLDAVKRNLDALRAMGKA